MHAIKKWVIATRLETVFLAWASVGLGSALAAFAGTFQWSILAGATLVASLLQLLRNLANDYGDFVQGADLVNKAKSPSAIQTGLVQLAQVRQALCWLCFAATVTGLWLLCMAALPLPTRLFFSVLGCLALGAALAYTLGRWPYGYQGGGDAAVLLFFGIVGVGGTFYLHTQQATWLWVGPALAHGCLTVGVLNVNNLRDLTADQKVGKKTIPVRIGRQAALGYHWGLLTGSVLAVLAFLWCHAHTPWPCVCLCTVPWLFQHGRAVCQQPPSQLTQELQRLVQLILVFATLLAVGVLL